MIESGYEGDGLVDRLRAGALDNAELSAEPVGVSDVIALLASLWAFDVSGEESASIFAARWEIPE